MIFKNCFNIYPLTIVKDRYGGSYSQGRYLDVSPAHKAWRRRGLDNA